MDFLRASLWTLYGLPYGLFYGLDTGFSTDTLRGFPTASPRARTEAGEWRRKPHVKVPSPRTAARRMSPRPFHGARQIGGRDAARTPYGFPHGRRTREARAARRMSLRTFYGARQGRDAGNASCPKPSAAFSLKLAWRQTAALGFPPLAGVSSSSSRTLPLPSERGTLCDALCGRLVRACVARCRAQQRGRSPLQGELRSP